ncbi:MAG: ATP-binding protein [Chloroflexota bacterium]|nr:ATP-binding protein [Chloroflexota bacterium]
MPDSAADHLLDQLDALDDTILSIASELDLDAVLQRIVDLARSLIGARYGALGIAGADGYLTDFITAGISATEREVIGDLPRGHGILGVLIREQQSLRLKDMHDDPRSVGFPPHHPPMTSFLGVPIRVRDDTIVNLYLTDKEGGNDFTAEDQRIVERLARHAAIAVANARRFTESEAQRRQLQTILDHMPDAVMIREAPGGRVLMANQLARDLLGYATLPEGGFAEPAVGFHPERPAGQPLAVRDTPTARALLQGEGSINEEVVIHDSDSRPVHLAVSAIPVRDDKGRVATVVSLFRDVTKAREAEQLKDDFLSLISHELRTPLTTIQGAAYMLLTQGDDLPLASRDALRVDLINESERLSRMLKNMLALAAYQAGRLHVERDPFLIQPILRQVAQEVRGRYSTHQVMVDVPKRLPPAEGDEELITQAVRNLAENAAKYSPGGGTITLGAEATDALMTVWVRDQGPGIAVAEQARIFQRFHRASTGAQGMGLGLYLCQRLVEAHGGRLWVESAPGEGSTFRFTLPIVVEDAKA